MINTFLITLLTITLLSCSNDIQQKLPADIEKEVQNRINTGYHLNTVIGIIDKNGTRYYNYGQMSLTDSLKPNENSIFEIGSIAKVFTTALLADLELNKEIEISNSIKHYMPVFEQVLANSNRDITLEDLINHTSGLPRNPTNVNRDDSNRLNDYSKADLIEFLSSYTVDSSTKEYSYSNLAYVVLENVIENKTGKSYESLINEKIWGTLGMNDSYFTVPEAKRNRLVTPYRGGEHVEELDMGEFPAGGGIKTTAKEMLGFIAAQLGMHSTTLDPALKLTHEERFSNIDGEFGQEYEGKLGLAWDIMERKESGKTIYYHKGGTNGFVSLAGFNLEDQIGVVVLASGHRWWSDLGFKILDPTYPLTITKE
jgi:D-alanyl-D-alanine-carboxypeptidase/D-alanyl-D-alanine-endopeptidase